MGLLGRSRQTSESSRSYQNLEKHPTFRQRIKMMSWNIPNFSGLLYQPTPVPPITTSKPVDVVSEKISLTAPPVTGSMEPPIPTLPHTPAVLHPVAEAAMKPLQHVIMRTSKDNRWGNAISPLLLQKAAEVIQDVGCRESLQTPNVIMALCTLGAALGSLDICTSDDAATSEIGVQNAVHTVKQCIQNLREQFPGHFAVANNNNVVAGVQVNAASGLKHQSGQRVNSEAVNNRAEWGIQINAPVFESMDYLTDAALKLASMKPGNSVA